MKLFYVRWPDNGQHTLAFAKDRHDCFDAWLGVAPVAVPQ